MALLDEFYENLISKATGLKTGLLQSLNSNKKEIDDLSVYSGVGPIEQTTYPQLPNKSQVQKNPFNMNEGFNEVSEGLQNVYQNLPAKTIPAKPKEDKKKGSDLGISDKQAFKIFGLTYKDIQKNWEKNGGFEGLMASPGFQIGLGIIQSSMQGKPLGSDIQDILLKSGAVSSAYRDKIKSRTQVLGPITMEQRSLVKSYLAGYGIGSPKWFDKALSFFSKDKQKVEAKYNEALDKIYTEAMKVARESTTAGKSREFDPSKDIPEAIKRLTDRGEINLRSDSWFRGGTVLSKGSGLLSKDAGPKYKASGGPVAADKSYIVGEKGPELFVPELDGNIINNDDLKVVNMLLESNPQLKGISRARAVKILKARFPDYF